MKIEIYTDGSCIGNPGPGGWGAIILNGGAVTKLSGHEKATTNNRMEMTAMIKAMEHIHKAKLSHEDITLFSDSNLLVQSLNLGWKRKANLDLWEDLDRAREGLKIKFIWVKAHHTNKYNNMVDELALKAATKP